MNTTVARTPTDGYTDLKYGSVLDDNGTPQVPTSATLALIINGGSFTPSTTPTIDKSGVFYRWNASDLSALPLPVVLDNLAKWSFVVDGVTIERIQYFDLAVANIVSRVSDSLLRQLLPQVDNRREFIESEATGGTTTTIVDTLELFTYAPNRFAGSTVKMLSGANDGQKRIIDAYDNRTATLTILEPFTFAIEQGDNYELALSWRPQIADAWIFIQQKLINVFGREKVAELLDGTDFTEVHKYYSLEKICQVLSSEPADEFDDKGSRYAQLAEMAFQQIKIKTGDSSEVDLVGQTVRYWGK